MSTRALVARPTDPADPSKFEGIYIHSDGYPEHTGFALFAQITDHFKGEQSGWFVSQDKATAYDYTYIARPEGLEMRRFGRGSITVPWDRERFHWLEADKKLRAA